VTGAGFAQTVVWGWLQYPEAKRTELYHMAQVSGMRISGQGLDKRFSPKAVVFLRTLAESALQQSISSEATEGILRRFQGVYVSDCTHLKLGGRHEKLALRWDLQSGKLSASLEAATTHEQRSAVLRQSLPAGALHLGDLGFFNLKQFNAWTTRGVYWLTRFKVGTYLYRPNGQPLALTDCLPQTDQSVCLPVHVGATTRVSAWLVAQRVTDPVYQQRQTAFQDLTRRQHPVSPAKQQLSRWTVYLTNVPDLSFEQAHILARTRWQIELLFKIWKSHAGLTRSVSQNPVRQQCELYAKLLAVLVAHWVILVSGWQHAHLRYLLALRMIRLHAFLFLRNIHSLSRLRSLLFTLAHDFTLLPLPARRKNAPAAFQLWQRFDLSRA
jgi:hypothetical protein